MHDNIARFGGDAGNVTLFGESGGALAVSAQLASPGAAGLFHRAIVQSGAYSLDSPSLAAEEAAGQAFANSAGCAGQDAACLRALSVVEVLTTQGFPPKGYLPLVDGYVLTRSLRQAFETGHFNAVPVMVGSNANEFSLLSAFLFDLVPPSFGGLGPITDANRTTALAVTLATFDLPRTVAGTDVRYPPGNFASATDQVDAVGTDAGFACRGRDVARALARRSLVHYYEFNDLLAPMVYLPPVRTSWGAYHAGELQYLFTMGRRAAAMPAALSAEQRRLADEMTSRWTGFARDGNPFAGGATAWPAFTRSTEQVLSLEPAASRVSTDFAARHRCDFWTGL